MMQGSYITTSKVQLRNVNRKNEKCSRNFFQAVDVKKGNFNKPIAMGFLRFDSNPHQATMLTDSGCSAA